jgi:hypothetical protein
MQLHRGIHNISSGNLQMNAGIDKSESLFFLLDIEMSHLTQSMAVLTHRYAVSIESAHGMQRVKGSFHVIVSLCLEWFHLQNYRP